MRGVVAALALSRRLGARWPDPGIPRKQLKSFRDNINRHVATEVALKAYDDFVLRTRDWLTVDSLARLTGFVKDPGYS